MKLAFILILLLTVLTLATYGQTHSICKGDTVRLSTNGGSLYEWQPHAGLSNPYSASPLASPTVTTVYRVQQLHTSGNLIVNGDFNQGNVGFSSQYRDSTNVIREGFYSIVDNPRDAHFAFRNCTDYTTGAGLMMVVNGSHLPNLKVWQQDIQVQPNTDYAFSAYVNAGISGGDKAVIQFSINGQLIGDTITILNIPCAWQRFYAIWNSDTATQASIAVVNQNTELRGNDFALDDILFEQFTTTIDSVRVEVNATPDTPIAEIASSDSLICSDTEATYNWYRDGHLLASHGRKIHADHGKPYQVQTVSYQGCLSDTSAPVEIRVTELKDHLHSTFSISPNPAGNTICFSRMEGTQELLILDSMGRVAMRQKVAEGHSVSVSALPPGLYRVQVAGQTMPLQVAR